MVFSLPRVWLRCEQWFLNPACLLGLWWCVHILTLGLIWHLFHHYRLSPANRDRDAETFIELVGFSAWWCVISLSSPLNIRTTGTISNAARCWPVYDELRWLRQWNVERLDSFHLEKGANLPIKLSRSWAWLATRSAWTMKSPRNIWLVVSINEVAMEGEWPFTSFTALCSRLAAALQL